MAVNSAWGIDVGNRALKAIKVVRDGDGIRIDDFELIEHETVLSDAGDNKESLIQSALAAFVQRHATKSTAAGIAVGGQNSFARFIKLPPVEKKKIPEIVRFEAIQQIPFPLDDVEWSYQLFENPDSPDVEVGIFAMRRDLIDKQIEAYRAVEINVDVVQMNPLAVYNAIAFDGRLKGTTMIMDLGAENTDLIIAEGEAIWLRSIPIGGNSLTEALAKQFKMSFSKAEDLKRNASTSKYQRQILQAMRPVFAELVSEVQRSIGFYTSSHRDARLKRIIALGGTFRLPGLQKYLQQNLQMDVERVDRFGAGALSDAKMATLFAENILSLVTAYGLAVQTMRMSAINSSLLPMHIRREKMWKDKNKWFAGAAALFLMGSGIAMGQYYLQNLQYNQNALIRAPITRTVTSAQALSLQWDNIEHQGSPDLQLITNIHGMMDYRYLWPSILTDIHNCLPTPQVNAASLPRGQRKQITIDSMTVTYVPDLSQTAGGATPAPSAPVDPNAPAPLALPAGTRGFVIDINCTTPNSGKYTFVTDTFIKQVQQLGLSNADQVKKGYIFLRASSQTATQVKQDPTRQSQLRAAYAARLGLQSRLAPPPAANGSAQPIGVQLNADGSIPPPPMQAVAPPQAPSGPPSVSPVPVNPDVIEPAFADPATHESVLSDWEVTIELVVVVDPSGLVAAAAPPAASP